MRVRAEIDLSAVRYNLEQMRKIVPEEADFFAVIKTDGYGHGAAEIAGEIESLPYVYGFCVATAEEGASLRESGITKPILILGYTFPESYETILSFSLMPTVFTRESAAGLSSAAVRSGKTLPFHLAIDTGMSRIGLQVTEEGADEGAEIARFPNLRIEGIFTHFARADEQDKSSTHAQIREFQRMLTLLSKRGISAPLRHCANSAAIMELPEASFDLVRAGITLYGLLPSAEVDASRLPMRPVMSLTSHVSHVKELTEGREVSYGGTYVVKGKRRVATVPVGYGDGYPRSLSGRGYVLIHGEIAPILGRVCMDQFMVDVTDIPGVTVGDEVRLLGKQGDRSITMEQLGELSERFNYELACDIGKRVPRIFYREQERISVREANY